MSYGAPIYGIGESAFLGMGRVKELHLTANRFLKVHPKAFTGMTKLRYLFLSDKICLIFDLYKKVLESLNLPTYTKKH